jgi:hypothetical protein
VGDRSSIRQGVAGALQQGIMGDYGGTVGEGKCGSVSLKQQVQWLSQVGLCRACRERACAWVHLFDRELQGLCNRTSWVTKGHCWRGQVWECVFKTGVARAVRQGTWGLRGAVGKGMCASALVPGAGLASSSLKRKSRNPFFGGFWPVSGLKLAVLSVSQKKAWLEANESAWGMLRRPLARGWGCAEIGSRAAPSPMLMIAGRVRRTATMGSVEVEVAGCVTPRHARGLGGQVGV